MPEPSPEASSTGNRPLLVILSGPSGVGKDAVLARMKESRFPIHYVVTMTTRPRRPQEKNTVDYHFVSREEFLRLQGQNQLLESALVYGNYYGVPKQDVTDALNAGRDVMVKVDVQGAEAIKKAMPQAVAIFLVPPSREELLQRLKQRSTETVQDLETRSQAAVQEFDRLPSFDYVVVNYRGELDRAVSSIISIINTEKYNNCRLEQLLEEQR